MALAESGIDSCMQSCVELILSLAYLRTSSFFQLTTPHCRRILRHPHNHFVVSFAFFLTLWALSCLLIIITTTDPVPVAPMRPSGLPTVCRTAPLTRALCRRCFWHIDTTPRIKCRGLSDVIKCSWCKGEKKRCEAVSSLFLFCFTFFRFSNVSGARAIG
jgi:hypothetical protein